MNWQPGTPVTTEQDRAAWAKWRNDRKRESQRYRRAKYPRIDYYPDALAETVIRDRTGQFVGGDLSSVINRIVTEWAEDHDLLPPE